MTMKKAFRRITAYAIAFMLAFLSMIPSAVITNAAPLDLLVTMEYNSQTGQYTLSYSATVQPAKTELTWHDPTGVLVTTTETGTYNAGKVSIPIDLLSDHIYDITVKAYTNMTDTIPYAQGSLYYLADITFRGESFNVMAKMSDIEDANPYLDPNSPGNAVVVQSGNDPKIRLSWKVPTIYNGSGIANVTSQTNNSFLTNLSDPEAAISKVGFQISMNKGKGSNVTLNYNTDYSGSSMIIEGAASTSVSGITNGNVTPDPNRFVSVILDQTNGIEPGTEYEYTNIGLIFENSASEQIPLRRTKLRTDSENHFLVKNIDNAFSDYGTDLSSVFTPLQFELTKVDVDKVEVKFRRLTNGVYPELFYQVQYAPRIDDLYSQTNTWVKIPNSTLPTSELYGSEIVEIDIPGTTHPEYYFRVVYFDSSSPLPKSSSLCVDLRLLGTDSGKPPLPREIKIEPIYSGRQTVTVPTTHLGSGNVEIPMSDLRISFEKPLNWKMITNWELYKNQDPYLDDDYTFHILLGSYLPDNNLEPETQSIGLTGSQTIYMPVKQKRVLVIGKKDLFQDPNDPNRLYCEIDGSELFYDYTDNSSITFENNEDPSEDGTPGDYPGFLIPNTTYYMQIFTSRYRDNADINADRWGNGGLALELRDKISYLSPILSFTTWPLNELPVPIPNMQLSPSTTVDTATGNMSLNGILVNYDRILTETEWQRYTNVQDNRQVRYDVYISRDPSSGFQLITTDSAIYPDEAEILTRQVTVTHDGSGEPIKPNTVYYLKAQASLIVGADTIGRSVFTPVKAITTPKIDSGSLDNVTRDPRSPSEFAINVDSEGELRLSDAWVELSWLHAERDVTYEMICTSVSVSPQAVEADYAADTFNTSFMTAYNEFRNPAGDSKIHIATNDARLAGLGYTIDENGKIVLPVKRDYLRPNRTYFFSLRAVRNRGQTDVNGNSIETVSRWITIPVTTRMVQPPAYLEAVRDLEVGFNVNCTINGSTADSMEIHMKKTGTPDSAYVKLIRSQYSVVKHGSIYYFRVYNLEPNQWYDFKLYNKTGNAWYNNAAASWGATAGTPVMAKTRDTLHEIEVRWEGEDPYTYYLEARAESDTEYEKLIYKASGFSDYGYDLANGTRVMFYREKTNLHVEEGSSKYIYYAKIQGKPVKQANGTVSSMPIKTNTLYFIKLWAYNLEDSLHIGPVSVRTDFSQKDYDDQKTKDNVVDVFNLEAEKLTRKLYWTIDKGKGYTVRALIKGDMVSGLLKASQGATVTVDLSEELQNPSAYEITVPQRILETIEANDSRLNLKLIGAEVTLNRGSIDFEALKQQTAANGAKEAMLKLYIERKASPKAALPTGFKAISKVYALSASYIGSRYTYAELNTMIYKILKDKNATGPFKYGLFDRELTKVLTQLDSYSYRTHTDLKDMVSGIMNTVETEMSKYLKDIIDGGSGLSTAFTSQKAALSFPNRIGIKLEYQYQTGLITPYINYLSSGWKEPAGSKAYVMQYSLFRAEKPGEYLIAVSGSVTVTPGTPYDAVFEKLGGKYDLSKVFGKTTILPSNPITGQQAVMLYAVVSEREAEITGLTPAQKASKLGVGDVIGAKQLTGYMDNQSSVSLAVKLYCDKAGIPISLLKPSKTIYISNASTISSRLYSHVVLGVDLGLIKLTNKTFNATARSTTGQVLDMVSKVLEKLGQ